jgi:hypothetical protein
MKAGALLQLLIAKTLKTMQGISRTILGHPQDTAVRWGHLQELFSVFSATILSAKL